MTIFKQGEIKSNVIVLSYIYICDSCGFTKTIKTDNECKCEKCESGKMVLVSSQTDIQEQIENVKKDHEDGKFVNLTNTKL
jgi:DNA-directed RNA polymerase subunit RPC12/RpoP